MADTPPVILADTSNQRLRQSMLLGSALEGGWTSPYPVGDHGTSFGPFQLHRGGALDSLGGTPQQAQDPKWAVKAMMPRYAQAANQISEQQWKNNPEVAAEQTARIAEGPAQDYFASQGRQTVDMKWNGVQQVLAGRKSLGGMPVEANLTSAGDGSTFTGAYSLWRVILGALTGNSTAAGNGAAAFIGSDIAAWVFRGALILFGAIIILIALRGLGSSSGSSPIVIQTGGGNAGNSGIPAERSSQAEQVYRRRARTSAAKGAPAGVAGDLVTAARESLT